MILDTDREAVQWTDDFASLLKVGILLSGKLKSLVIADLRQALDLFRVSACSIKSI